MKISLNMAQRYSNVDFSAIDRDELVRKIGAQLGGVEGVVDFAPAYAGVIVARVVACDDHPNADKLHVCLVDDGGVVKDVERNEQGYVTVVCGAPNVRVGLLVGWIPPGATVPESYGTTEPFVLSARTLRGVVSNGMLGSPRELRVNDSHDGILEIDPAAVGDELAMPGTAFGKLYGLSDYVVDVENKMFTHRPDCFGVLGVARELAGVTGQAFKSPEWYREAGDVSLLAFGVNRLPVTARVESPDDIPRFVVMSLDGIIIAPSPVWLQAVLGRIGIRPINNVVDATNFIMYLTGQPTHAYDYDKLAARSANGVPSLIARRSVAGDKLVLLNGKTVIWDEAMPSDIVIATDNELVGLAGVMGGGDTEVDENTTKIVLEAASFDMYSIRRASMRHGVFTDAVARFNKGQSSRQNLAVMSYLVSYLVDTVGAKVASDVVDIYQKPAEAAVVEVAPAFINARLGLTMTGEEIAAVLRNVEFDVTQSAEALRITAPFWRTDIDIAEDIVEEVGRLYGYDKLPLELPQRSLTPVTPDPLFSLKNSIRTTLARAGANELLTYTFVHGKLLEKAGQDAAQTFALSNALSPDLQYYRLSLTPSLLEKVHPNSKAGYDEFALFEIGRAHHIDLKDTEGLPAEFTRVALVYAASDKTAARRQGAAYYRARHYLDYLLAQLGTAKPLSYRPLAEMDLSAHALIGQMVAPFAPERSAGLWDGERMVAVVGEYRAEVQRQLKLPAYSAGFELLHSALAATPPVQYRSLSRFPSVAQDLCLKVSNDTSYVTVYDFVQAQLDATLVHGVTWQLSPVDIYQRPDDLEHRQITVRLVATSNDRTLTDGEITQAVTTIAQRAAKTLAAERV